MIQRAFVPWGVEQGRRCSGLMLERAIGAIIASARCWMRKSGLSIRSRAQLFPSRSPRASWRLIEVFSLIYRLNV